MNSAKNLFIGKCCREMSGVTHSNFVFIFLLRQKFFSLLIFTVLNSKDKRQIWNHSC